MTNATLLQTQVTPSDCGIRRGSGSSLRAPCPNSGPRRWLSRCLCRTRRGHWPDHLPSSYSLRWWRLCFAVEREESQSHAERSTRPGRGTPLILNRGAVVMPRCSSKARSLPARIGVSAPKDSTSSASRYIFSGSVSLGGGCYSSVLSSVLWSSGCCSLAGESRAVGLSGTTSSISKGSSSHDASCGMTGWDS
jgi:hypothetical protein